MGICARLGKLQKIHRTKRTALTCRKVPDRKRSSASAEELANKGHGLSRAALLMRSDRASEGAEKLMLCVRARLYPGLSDEG